MSTEISNGQARELPIFHAVHGFYIGFLSAAAVCSSSDWTEFKRNTSNTLRLAVCIEAVIDVEEGFPNSIGNTATLSVRCKIDFDLVYLKACLEIVPNASWFRKEGIRRHRKGYFSITCRARRVSPISRTRRHSQPPYRATKKNLFSSRLSKVNIRTTPTGIHGSFHNSKNADNAHALKVLCADNRKLQLPGADRLRLPLRSTGDSEIITTGASHDVALDLILCKQADWFQTVKRTLANVPEGKKSKVFHLLERELCAKLALVEKRRRRKGGFASRRN